MIDLPVWVETDLKALDHNIKEICRVVGPGVEVMAVVKANAYGHGLVEVSRTVLAGGANRIAVARSAEGVELRRAGVTAPILVLGYTPPGLIPEVVEYGLEQTIHERDYALLVDGLAAGLGARLPVHLKVDTGMGRIGVVAGSGSTVREIKEMASLPNLDPVGIFTHFAAADEADRSYTIRQLEIFHHLLAALEREGLHFTLRHAANSAGLIGFPESRLNLVRAGIIIYGLYPSEQVDRGSISLKPVMSFKTRVVQVKEVGPGASLSYGCTYITPRASTIATLSVGYADGYSRQLSSRGEVLVRGRRAPVVGRVCMDQCLVDVSGIPGVAAGDEVVLFGRQGGQELAVEEVARWIGTINYEVVCMVAARVPRIYV